MELFLPFQGLRSKNFFYSIFSISTKEFRIDFQNRKWNYPNRKWNYPYRKWNYLSYFQASNQKTSLTKGFSFTPRRSKLIFLITGIIYLIKNFFYKMFLIKDLKIDFPSTPTSTPTVTPT